MDRRAFIAMVGGCVLTAPLVAEAQRAGKSVTVGYLGNSSPSLEANLVDAFRDGLRQLGYVEGRNLIIEFRWADGQQERYATVAQELVRLKPDIILTAGTQGTVAAKQATQSIPIVTAVVGEPVAAGLVSSLAKPGGNVTGLSTLAPEVEGKRLELLKQAVPKLSRVVVLLNPDNPFSSIGWKAVPPAADVLHIKLQRIEAGSRSDIDRALATIKAARPDGLVVLPDRVLLAYRAPIVQFLIGNHIPAMFPFREFAQAGGLMAYGPDQVDMYRRAATYVDKILKGAKPGDLPVEQPTKFELVINLKTAKAIGLTIPQSVLGRADEVIQ
ncbi:MAG TPA: ABC transporter substrate-binding protein [Myxococcaceae bacterium]|nr:ABC transporter substrate-binding protein [Myxococcaceae bacterium]